MRSVERRHHPLARAGLLGLVACALLGACNALDRRPLTDVASTPTAEAKAKAAAGASSPRAATPADAPAKAAPEPVRPEVQRAFDAALAALAAGRVAEAERGFSALTKSSPGLAGPYANLGLIHRQAGRTREAVAALERAAQLSPERAELHNQLGVAYRAAGDFAKAKASYERSIALDPNHAAALLNLGILYDLYLWDGERALELYDRYLRLAPGDEQVSRWSADLRNRLAPKNAATRKEQG